jgi:CRISPR-associated protein Csm1
VNEKLMQQSCRVALAAYLHDLGKFAERAGAFDNSPRLDAHLQLYCPWHEKGGWFSHRHAANTALAFDLIEKHLPDLLGQGSLDRDASPFVGRRRAGDEGDIEPSDSLINAAAGHHKPDTFLQWIIATADRVASGFEREEFDRYNDSKDETRTGLNHFTARLLPLFEQIQLSEPRSAERPLRYRYPLKALAPSTIFPVEARNCETRDKDSAKNEYSGLWQAFVNDLEQIPPSHRSNWALWLDHFDSLWLTYTHAIPSATAFNVKPEVSLYDHSRTTAALAVALWRWHAAQNRTDESAARAMRERSDYAEHKFLLVQGDFFGIQNFVFAAGGETRKQAAKLLRGRSFQVALFTELAALRLLDELSLPPTSQVLNAAGKFLIVAPNTGEVRQALAALRKEFDGWFLKQTFGLAGVGLAWHEASCSDFLKTKQGEQSRYARLMAELHQSLDLAKHKRFDLCGEGARVFAQDFPHGVCQYNGWIPADRPSAQDQPASCALSRDQIKIGESLLRFDRLLVLRDSAAGEIRTSGSTVPLDLDVFGYRVAFTENEEASGRFGDLARNQALRRCWDFSPADDSDGTGVKPPWAGYGRRFISGFAPRVRPEDLAAFPLRYVGVEEAELPDEGQLKTLDMIACEDREPDGSGGWIGINALGILKGDVDNLGEMFRIGLGDPTFAKTAALSRQLNGFFAIYLPWLLARAFPNVYTVFAGGDDFLLIAPWRTAQKLAVKMRDDFARYAADNPAIHFSAGIATQKPGAPIAALAELAEDALEAAKANLGKNAITCFDETVPWKEWSALDEALESFDDLRVEEALTSGYVYRLLQFVDMCANETKRPDAALWRAQFKYATRRYVVDKRKGLDEQSRSQLFARLAQEIGGAIARLGSRYRVVLFNHLYRMRAL